MLSCTSSGVPKPEGCLCHRPEMSAVTRRIGGLSRRGSSLPQRPRPRSSPSSRRPRRQPASCSRTSGCSTEVGHFARGSPPARRGRPIRAVATGNPAAAGRCARDRLRRPGAHAGPDRRALARPLRRPAVSTLLTADAGYILLAASAEAERTLMRGFTTVRDLGGPVFALKQAIDEGLVPGPRIYPSGAMITTTGGHGDLRPLSDMPREPGEPPADRALRRRAIVDGPDEIRLRVREQLMQGASQIKLVGGGGVSSPRSPLDMTTSARPSCARRSRSPRDWNTYVTVHAYAPDTIRAGDRRRGQCIEHAHLMDEETAELMAEKGVWLSIQPFLTERGFGAADRAEPRNAAPGLRRRRTRAYELAKAQLKTAFGSDLLFSPPRWRRQGTMLTHLTPLVLARRDPAHGDRRPMPSCSPCRAPQSLSGQARRDRGGRACRPPAGRRQPARGSQADGRARQEPAVIMKDGKIHKNTLKA